jgi:hypothetical protein
MTERKLEVHEEPLLATTVYLAAFVVYAFTAYRSVSGGDSGELIGAVASGGVIHPPGYPLYSLLGALFARLPLGTLAYRVTLLSCVSDALASAVLALAVRRFTRSWPAGFVAGGLFAFLPGTWRYATVAEVFALNNLAVALLVLFAVLYDETRARRFAFAGAFVFGLGLANHQTVMFTAVPVIAWALVASKGGLLRARALSGLVLAGALGLLPYLVLPVLASHRAFVSWGAADTWDGFWVHVLREEYGTFQLAPAGVGADVRPGDLLGLFAEHAYAGFHAWGLALALVGAGAAAYGARTRPLGVVLVAPLLVSTLVMATLGNLPTGSALYREILARFWQQPELFVALYAGVGVAFAATLARPLPWALAPLLVVPPVVTRYRAMDHHGDSAVEQYGREMLRVVPEGGILVTKGDLITNTVRYLRLSERARPDVRIVDQELLATPWGKDLFEKTAPGVVFPGPTLSVDPRRGFPLKALFDANQGAAIVVCGGTMPGDHTADATYGLWPLGFCDEVRSGRLPVSLDQWIEESERASPRIQFTKGAARPAETDVWEGVVWSDLWEARQARAAHLIQVIGKNPSQQRLLPVAVDILPRVVDENPDVGAHVYKNLAIAIGRVGIETDAQKKAALRAWEGYLAKAPVSDRELRTIRAEMDRLRR